MEMPDLTVQDVFYAFYDGYEKKYKPSGQQRKAAFCIMNCKTGSLGANVSVCEDCGCIHIHFNSCRNRCCPMCQELPKQKWIDARKEDVLEAPYFHVVFTVPEELNPVIYSNQSLLYSAMYQAVSATLKELSQDTKYLGADIGFISILHTWGSAMNYHPHIHCIVLGGGLDRKNQWKDRGKDFFLPVKVLSRVFRGKLMDKIKGLWKMGKLVFHGTAEQYGSRHAFQGLVDQCYGKEWVPYSKKTFNGAQSVIDYLGKYTHRIAISSHRLVSMDEKNVTFMVKDYAEHGKWRRQTVSGVEFIRRFLMHVVPKGFVRIRHYGLLSSRNKAPKLALCRFLLGCKKYISALREMKTDEMLKHLYQVDVHVCRECGGPMKKAMQRKEILLA